MSSLRVTVQVDPPSTDRAELDRLMDGEISKFEDFFTKRQKAQGLDGVPLSSFERGTLKAYLLFARTK